MMGSGSGVEGVGKQLFADMAASATEKVATQGKDMSVKPCRIASTDGNPALDVFRQQVAAGDTTDSCSTPTGLRQEPCVAAAYSSPDKAVVRLTANNDRVLKSA